MALAFSTDFFPETLIRKLVDCGHRGGVNVIRRVYPFVERATLFST
jgi:hypothetical protein